MAHIPILPNRINMRMCGNLLIFYFLLLRNSELTHKWNNNIDMVRKIESLELEVTKVVAVRSRMKVKEVV